MEEKKILAEQEAKTIFSNVGQLHQFHDMFSEDLVKRVKVWTPRQKIGDIFVKMVSRYCL